MAQVRYILTDIEGTTTPITFVHDVLFPYSREHLPDFVRKHSDRPEVRSALENTKATVKSEQSRTLDDDGAVQQLLDWVAQDRKHPALKSLQGMIWRDGYESGAFTSQIYADVRPALARWKEEGLTLGIYSSGSVEAQKLLFKYSEQGDMTPLFSHYFDTEVGAKREPAAYATILARLGRQGADVLFLSDIPEELVAAAQHGIQTMQLLRPGTKPDPAQRHARDFEEVAGLLSRRHT